MTYFQAKYYVTEYLYFCRYSIIFGLILVLLPILGPARAPAMLANSFVISFWGTILLGFIAAFYCWAIVYTFKLTWISLPLRCMLPFKKKLNPADVKAGWKHVGKTIAENLAVSGYVLFPFSVALLAILLALPLFAIVFINADSSRVNAAIGLAIGVGCALVVRYLSGSIFERLGAQQARGDEEKEKRRAAAWNDELESYGNPENPSLLERFKAVYLRIDRDFNIAPAMRVVHNRAAGFFLCSLLVVIAMGGLFIPTFSFNSSLPALVILLCILTLLTWMFGFVGYVFDKDRVPVALMLGLVGVALVLIPNNHVYRVSKWPENAPSFTANEALAARVKKQRKASAGNERPFVAVAASGGGIRAALWTAYALEHLEEEVDGFGDQVGLISSVSGGSQGSLYYYDRAVLKSGSTVSASKAAGDSSLTALVWGIAYLEFPRLIAGSSLGSYDRGWAQELAWEKHVTNSPTLSSLAENVKKGDYPLHIYNSCFQESAQRYLLSPAIVEPPTTNATEPLTALIKKQELLDRARNSRELDRDMRLVTAARLSASFPYATPQANAADSSSKNPTGSYHAADGGYYDNSGLLTTIEVLDRYLEEHDDAPSRMAIIEIRADAGDFAGEETAVPGNLGMEIIGPPKTAFNVVFGSQAARNRQEVRWVGQIWKERDTVTLRHFVFYLSGGPLSWHLSEMERKRIRAHWPTDADFEEPSSKVTTAREKARAFNAEQLSELRKFMQVQKTSTGNAQ
ncbi:MAG: hypothetical protein ACI9G1_003621 [Pirellulaceae bacterium]